MAGADRLSGLSDDLLASIVSLLPTREAVRTVALSRRWRPVWLRTHSLILDSRSYVDHSKDPYAYAGRQDQGIQDRLFSDAGEFLDQCNHVRKLSLSVHGRDKDYFQNVMGRETRDSYDLMASLLAAPALRYLEEVRVKLEVTKRGADYQWEEKLSGWVYKLDPAELPGHTLRVLDLDFCRLESDAAISFPLLSSLRLYKCSSSTKDLEGWIRTAPSLANMHIQDHNFYGRRSDDDKRFSLHSPSLTTLTLVPGSWSGEHYELDVPHLLAFKYKGESQAFSMKSQTTKLVRVDLTATQTWFASIWQLLSNFRHTKAIKLKVPSIEDIAVDKEVQHEHLFTLSGLERLELQGFSDPGRRNETALAVANLLQCCPVIHYLLIRIPTHPYRTHYVHRRNTEVRVSDFDVSMDVFRRRYSKEMVPLMLDQDDEVAVLPGLTGCRFRCLEDHLKSVTLQFELKELNSFEVCLAKFFAENCMVLEVLQIHDGTHNFLRHINWMVERWGAKQRKQMDLDSANSSKQRGKRKRNYRACSAE
ncbi:unnamed protein product [Alopecurus aequalis]